jgi:hypothetical protein
MGNSILRTYKDFSFGWVPDQVEKDPDNIPDNGLELADNVDINGRGGPCKRPGSAKLNSVSYGANCKQVDEWEKSDSSVQLIGVVGTDFCFFAEDGAKTIVQALNASAGKAWWFPTITGGADNLYFGDSYKYFVWNGTTSAEVTPAAGAGLTFVKAAKKVIWHSKSHRYFAIKNGSSGVNYSEPDDPTYFKATNMLYPTQAEGSPVGIEEFGDAILVRFQTGAYIWRGYDPTADVVWLPIPLRVGGFNPYDSAIIEGSLVFPGRGGIYAPGMSLLGTNITAEASGDLVPNVAQGRVTSVIESITNAATVCTIDDPSSGKTYIAYTDVANATTNSKVLVWQRKKGGGFTRYLGWNVNHWCLRKNGDLLFATNNYIMKTKQTAFNDDGVAISFALKTKWFSFGDELMNYIKALYLTYLTSQQNQTASSVDLTVDVDNGSLGVSHTGISLNTGFVWGQVWGGTWGAPAIITKERETYLEGLRFQSTLENNTVNEAIDIYAIAFRFKVGRPEGDLA